MGLGPLYLHSSLMGVFCHVTLSTNNLDSVDNFETYYYFIWRISGSMSTVRNSYEFGFYGAIPARWSCYLQHLAVVSILGATS